MKSWLPAPLLSAAVFVVWLMLVGTVEPAHLLLAATLALVLPLVAQRLRDEPARVQRPLVAARLGLRVLWDIVVSNIEVARRILGRQSLIHPGFVWVPLDITNPHGIAALAGIITMTPGTLSSELTADRRHLLVHCFHLEDADATMAQIKQRYETPLREIFP
ncbi:MAG: Na+/H+ antiporter subunit E [Arenimonas sp.]|uniref:Na+/H+ antiporter subunit E n=1 Tax=Arenimonas sp. TaxID=1872635 RepID=UPI0025BBEB6E|nr:Na+/H+ antiporter subunit E [Arenimonas sp.]MBW8367133.1 Na+/H+ antiporter subunit E [Arenimonas sp.]